MTWCLTILSLVRRDWVALPRQDWFYRKRLGLCLMGFLLVLVSLTVWTSSPGSPGPLLFRHLTWGLLVLGFLLGLAEGGQLLAPERHQQTLDLILLSDVGSLQLLLAKLLIGLGHTTLTLLSTLPYFAIAAGLGGLSWRLAGLLALLLAGVVYLGVALSLSIAASLHDVGRARITTSVIGISLYLLLPALLSILINLYSLLPADALVLVTPLLAVQSLFTNQSESLLVGHIGLLGMLGSLLLLAGAAGLRRSLGRQPRRGGLLQQWRDDLRATKTFRKLMIRPDIAGNPVAWQDLHLIHGGQRASWLKLLFGTTLLTVIVLGFGAMAGLSITEAWQKVWVFVSLFFGAVLAAGTIWSSNACFLREKRHGALEVLLTSDLRIDELLLGKLIGILVAYSPYGICLFISLAGGLATSSNPTDQFNLFLVAIQLLAVLYTCCSVSIYLALRSPQRGNLAPLLIAYCALWAVIAFLFPRQNGTAANALFALISAVWHIYIGSLCWRSMLQQGREMLLASLSAVKQPSPLL